ncbi:MAG: SLBB domain-containing protein, partial [Actinomycetota bacterium]|nr:SLBB domain-containing protein [Actinomycetota bacterium]
MPDLPLPSPSGDSGADRSLPLWLERIARWWSTVSELSWPRVAIGAAVAAVVLGGIVLLIRKPAAPPLVLPRAPVETPPPSTTGPAATGGPATITVHAAGALVRPGVYAVPEGARVADVVDAAGGTGGEADVDQLNLAAKVTDGERV